MNPKKKILNGSKSSAVLLLHREFAHLHDSPFACLAVLFLKGLAAAQCWRCPVYLSRSLENTCMLMKTVYSPQEVGHLFAPLSSLAFPLKCPGANGKVELDRHRTLVTQFAYSLPSLCPCQDSRGPHNAPASRGSYKSLTERWAKLLPTMVRVSQSPQKSHLYETRLIIVLVTRERARNNLCIKRSVSSLREWSRLGECISAGLRLSWVRGGRWECRLVEREGGVKQERRNGSSTQGYFSTINTTHRRHHLSHLWDPKSHKWPLNYSITYLCSIPSKLSALLSSLTGEPQPRRMK